MTHETVPTMLVKDKETGHVFLTNVSDFNPETHDAVKEDKKPTSEFDREAAKQKLTEAGIAFAANVSDKKLKELVAGIKDEPAAPVLSIGEVEGGFAILDAEGVQQGNTIATKEEADAMLALMVI